MYVGRFLIVGPEVGAYRVSSRSFPNRRIDDRGEALTVGPTAEAPETDNPYVGYNCLRIVETPGAVARETAVFGNGSHVDPIAEKLERGYPARDALAASLLALDYEKDDYDTPRIAATIGEGGAGGAGKGEAYVGIVRKDALLVEAVSEPTLVATYERDRPEAFEFEAGSAEAAAREAYDLEFEHAVCAAGVARIGGEFETAIVNDS